MRFRPIELILDIEPRSTARAGPPEERVSHSQCEIAEEAIDIEVISALVAVSTLDGEDLFSQFRVFGVLDLPQPHQVVCLRANPVDRIK